MASTIGFYHIRLHALWHSICKNCFLTIAEDSTEENLKTAEDRHKCEGPPLERRPLPKARHWSNQ